MTLQPDPRATALTRARYQRISVLYDLMEVLPERRYIPWREILWRQVPDGKILEVGVGTGKNMPFYPSYPSKAQITAIDLTPGMLKHARQRADEMGLNIDLRLDDVQALDFQDETFDSVVSTFVFCSVPDAVLGLREIKRVLKPGGQVFLLEHMRSPNRILGALMDLLNPFVVRMMGANINRRTVENIRAAGFEIDEIEDLAFGGIFKRISAHKMEIK